MGSNSISNNSNNIRVNSNYTNKKYGSTIGKSGGSSQAALASRARTAKTEEFDLSSPTVIAQKENMVKKSEVTKQIENYISTLENMVKQLEQEKEELLEKNRRFVDSANRGAYPGLFIEEKNQGSRKKYLSPSEAIKSDECFKKYLKENGYPTDKNRMTPEKYQLLKNEYANYINTTYTNKYNEYFKEKMGMTYAEYRERITQINSDLETIKASKYELVQQAKEQPYIELMDTDDFQNYINNNKNNPDSELSKLYEIKNGTVETNDDSYWRFKYFTEQDMLIFSYLWDTQSPKVAREYAEAIEDKLNKAEGLAKANEFLDKLRDENGNIDANAWNGILSGGKGFGDGVLTFFDGLGNLFNSEGMMSVTQYEQMYILNELTNSSGNYINKLATQINETKGEEAAQEFISKIYTNNEINLEYAKRVLSEQEYNNLTIKIETDKKSLLDNTYELGSSAGNMVPSMIVSLAVSAVATPVAGSVAGSTLMGLSAGGNSKNQALVQGNDLSSSIMYGVFSGVSEKTLGLLLGNIPGLNVSSSLSVKGLFKEGLEEMLQEYVDAGLRATILDEKVDVTDITMMTDEVLSKIDNVDNVRFRLQDGSEIDVNSLIQKRDLSKTRSTLKTESPTFAPEVQTLFYENTIEENILEVIKRHDDKYGPGHALKQLRAFFDIKNEKYMDYNLITKSGGAREILLMYTPQQIAHALENLNYINSPVYVSGYFSRYGSSKEAKYGCDQGGIESLCTYTYNGRKYTYEQAMVIFNSALNSGRPLPHFKKEATPEYFFLKNKLVSQGFSSSDASIIMSTINDAGACSYAATVNEIFRAFAGKEVEFQQKFGYSMYKIENGKRRLNFNELLLDLYVHANKAENGGGFILADNRLNPYLLNRNRHDVFGRTMLDAKQQVYLSYSIDGKNESVIANFLIPKGIDWYRSFKIASNYNRIIGYNDFSNILNNVYLEMSKGHSVSLDIFKGSGVINMKSTNEGLYPSVSTNTWSEGGGHSVFVTGIGSNGFYVSSWGREYLIPFADLQNGGYFTINCSVIGFS